MKKIYILFLAFILAGCPNSNPIGPENTDTEDISVDPTVEDIVTDVLSGQDNYIGKIVRINGIVEKAAKDFNPAPDASKDQITIQTGDSDVEFFILGNKVHAPSIEPNKLITTYKRHSSYEFYIFIARTLPHPYIANGYRIASYLIKDEIDTTIDSFVSAIRSDNQKHEYINSIIHLKDGAKVRSGKGIIREGIPDFDLPEEISLKTNDNTVYFAVKDYISPTNTNRLQKFEDGLTYDNFVLFIESIHEDTDLVFTVINSIIVWNEPE